MQYIYFQSVYKNSDYHYFPELIRTTIPVSKLQEFIRKVNINLYNTGAPIGLVVEVLSVWRYI